MRSRTSRRRLRDRFSAFLAGPTARRRKRPRSLASVAEMLESRILLTAAPIGDQFVVAEIQGFTSTPAGIAVHSSGAFTAAWESFEQDGSGFGVFAQRYDAGGSPLAAPFQVNITTAMDQSAPVIASDAGGNVLIVWQSKGQNGVDYDICGQWYDSLGNPMGSEFVLNGTTAGDQIAPALAIDGAGSAIISWQSFEQDGSDWGVYYTRLDAVAGGVYDTTPSGDVLVNDAITGIQQAPTVAAADNGNFVIAWEAIDPAGGSDASLDVYAKVYGPGGTEIAGELRVNTETLRDQVTPQAAMDADGDFAVVWVGGGIPGSGSDVFGQRFDETGAAQGSQFRVNNTTLAAQVGGVVSMDDAGNFLVAWQSVHQDGFSEGIFGREYDAAGNTLVDEFQVNTVTEGPQSIPAIAMNGTGRAVVAWHGKNEEHESALFAQRFQVPNADPNLLKVGGELELAPFVELEGHAASAAMDVLGNPVVVFESYDQDGDGLGVYGQLLDIYGDPIGGPFLVNTGATDGNQSAPAAARAPDGRFIVAWQSNHQDAEGYDIYAQRYDANGLPVGTAFRVNTTLAGDQVTPAVAMGDNGRFVIAWQGDGGDTTTDIFAQRYDASGNPVGGEFRVNNETARDQVMPAVTMNAAGEFAVAWVSSHPAETIPEIDPEKSVFVQWYDADGVSTGDEVLAHTYVKDAQESPKIGMDAAGNFVVAWQSINQDGSTWGVYARQFLADKTPVQTEEIQVNETTEGLQRLVGLGVDADGHFVVAFESTVPGTDDGISTDIYRREFLPDGTPDGSENLVNTWTGGPQTLPVVARAATGNYGVFWLGQGFSHIDGVHGRLYDVNLVDDPGQPSRIPVGDQFLVGPTLGFENSSPAIAVQADGTFMAAYESFEEDGSGFGIFAQRYNADGTVIDGSKVQVNTTTVDDQSAPAIATDGAGNTLIVWQSKDDDASFGIFGRWFYADGSTSAEFQLNSTETSDQTRPDVAMDSMGRAVVTWQSLGQDGDGWGVYYARLDSVGDMTGAELPANVATTGDQQAPSVAAAASDGQFVIAWQGPAQVEEGEEASVEVFARRFESDGDALGDEFTVNDTPQKDQILPDVAMDANGDAVVVWQVEGQTGSGSDVYGRRMNSSGTLLGDDFRVNETTQRPQRLPAVAMDADGNFLVSWQSQHQDGFSWGIYGREYDASGNTLVGEFPINHRVEGPQTSPAVASNASGQTLVAWLGNSSTHEPSVLAHRYAMPNVEPDFSVGGEISLTTYAGLEEMPPAAAMNANREAVVAWVSYAEDGSGLGVFAQLLDKYGAPIGDRIAVNSFTAGNQGAPAVARAPDGQFVIVWQSEDQEEGGDGYGIYAQRYSATGVPEGPTFLVNTTVAGDQKAPTVAMGTDGRFVIAWESVSDDGSLDIMAQRYLPDGQAVGGEFRVNNLTGLDQKDPAIAMNAAGQFVIAWVSDHPALEPETVDTEKSIFVQWYDSNGQATGDEVLVHKYVKDAQEAPAVGIDGTGRFVVGWQSINQDGNSWGVFARRFLADKTPVERREFVVNETRMGPQRYVGLGMDEFGRFVITWQSNTRAELADGGGGGGGGGQNPNTPEGSSWDLFSRQYGFDGQREGGELPVNQWQMGPQIRPVVAQAAGGDFGIFWIGQGPDHIEGVHGRLYQNLFDLGDAADPAYPTLLSSNGARHLPWSELYLGSGVDVEVEGQPTADATGDDLDVTGDDEDGVVLPIVMIPGMVATATVTASAAGKLDAWIDYNQNGVFEQAERIAASLDVVAGENAVPFIVPAAALPGTSTARFRISSAGGLAPDGVAVDGEVEDHRVEISSQNSARLVDDPANPGQKILVVVGSTGKNYLTIAPDSVGNLVVREGKKVKSSTVLGVFLSTEVSRIVAYGLAGDDTIRVDSRISTPAELHGNAGKDALYGGAGDDLLYGDEGNDTLSGDGGSDVLVGGLDKDKLTGGYGRDLLIGGAGSDGLNGGEDDDILIGGSNTHDSQPSALSAIMAIWRSAAGFFDRIASLGGMLNANTVISDGIREKVTGGRGRDWMIDYESLDQFKDFDSNPTTGDHRN